MAKFVYVRALEFDAETEDDAWKALVKHLNEELSDSLIQHPAQYWALDEMSSHIANVLDDKEIL